MSLENEVKDKPKPSYESPRQEFEILDANNWEEWSNKYINKQLIDLQK